MKILLVMPLPLSDLGGVTTFVTQLQDGLNDRGHKALLLLPGGGDRIGPLAGGRADAHGIFLRPVYVRRAVLRGVVAFCGYLPLTLYRLWRFLKRERIQVVHIHFPTPSLLYFYALRVIGPWKLMVTLHGSDIYSLSKRTWLYRTLLGILLSGADSVIAGTAHLIQSVKAAYPRFTGRTRVIPNGNALVECQLPVRSAQQIELPERYILAVGNLVKRKGYDVLLRAVALARDRGHGLNLVLVGEGPEASSLAALAEQLKVQDRVVFVGKVPHREILPFYSEAQFFVHPAREEAQGLVLLEAMFSGKAVVATRVLGIPEVVRDGDTGLLVEPDDAESLASALIKLATDEALRDTLAERACAYVTREHTWGRFMTRYIAGYEAVIRGMTSDANPAIQRTELTKSSECPPTAL